MEDKTQEEQKETQLDLVDKDELVEEAEIKETEEKEEDSDDEDDDEVPQRLRSRLYDYIHIPLKTMDKIIYVVVAAIIVLIIFGIVKQ